MEIDPIGVVMRWITVYGLVGLFAAALAERFLPVIPSYGLLLSVGISVSDGVWSLLPHRSEVLSAVLPASTAFELWATSARCAFSR
jgi:membrane protein DedA with SNARE-associated domain